MTGVEKKQPKLAPRGQKNRKPHGSSSCCKSLVYVLLLSSVAVGILYFVGDILEQYQAKRLAEEFPELYCNQLNDLKEAPSCYAKLALETPEKCHIWNHLGMSIVARNQEFSSGNHIRMPDGGAENLLSNKELSTADIFQKALSCDPQNAEHWINVGKTLKMGDVAEVNTMPIRKLTTAQKSLESEVSEEHKRERTDIRSFGRKKPSSTTSEESEGESDNAEEDVLDISGGAEKVDPVQVVPDDEEENGGITIFGEDCPEDQLTGEFGEDDSDTKLNENGEQVPNARVFHKDDEGNIVDEVGNHPVFTQEDCYVRALELDEKHGETWNALVIMRGESSPTIAVGGRKYNQYQLLLKALEVDFWNPGTWRTIAQRTEGKGLVFDHKGEEYDYARSKAMFYEAKKRKSDELEKKYTDSDLSVGGDSEDKNSFIDALFSWLGDDNEEEEADE